MPSISRNTNSVQAFLRTITFFVILGVLSLLLIPLGALMNELLGEGGSLIIFIVFGIDLWIAGTASKMFFVLPEWERLILLKIGKFAGTKGPGFFMIPPFIYSVAAIIDTRIVTKQVEATATLTQDSVPTKVTAAIEFEVEDPRKAVINVKDYLSSVIWLSTEALKNTIGGLDLKELLSNREEISSQLKKQIDEEAANYGINVRAVRITDIDTPSQLIEELAVIARARRASEAKQIQADAEVAVARKMAEASEILSEQPGGFKLRELQNLAEMAKEGSTMVIIYPTDSASGREIANSSVSTITQMNQKIKKLGEV